MQYLFLKGTFCYNRFMQIICHRIFIVFSAALLLCACASTQEKKRQVMASIESHEMTPSQVFLYRDKIHIRYNYENTWFDLFETLKELSLYIFNKDFTDKERFYLMGVSMGV